MYKKPTNCRASTSNSAHTRGSDGSAAPSKVSMKELGFYDVNTALARTVEALKNATVASKKNRVPKEEITALLKDAIAKGNHSQMRIQSRHAEHERRHTCRVSHLY